MKRSKRIIIMLVLLAAFALLVFPGWNPFMDEGSKLAVTAQIQRAFGGLFGGIGILTPARLISAAAVVVFMVIVSLLICWPLELLAKMGLSDRANHYPSQLSGGQQQRVAIARALALHPDILCFDEPTSALDPELTGEVLKVIRSLAEQKTTMIIVTHEMAFARDVADHVIFMDGGVIVEQGDAHQVIEHPREERTRQFLSRYAEN